MSGHSRLTRASSRHTTGLPAAVNQIFGDRRELDRFSGEFKSLAPDVVLDMLAFTREDAGRVVVPSSIDVYRA